MTNQNDDLRRTDPGFAERMLRFADVEVAQDPDTALDPQTRYLAILATLLGCQAPTNSASSWHAHSTRGSRRCR